MGQTIFEIMYNNKGVIPKSEDGRLLSRVSYSTVEEALTNPDIENARVGNLVIFNGNTYSVLTDSPKTPDDFLNLIKTSVKPFMSANFDVDGLYSWLKASKINGEEAPPAVGTNISADFDIADLSGNDNKFIVKTVGNMTYQEGGQGDKPYIRRVGSGALRTPTLPTTNVTIFCVFKNIGDVVGRFMSSPTTNSLLFSWNTSRNVMYLNGNPAWHTNSSLLEAQVDGAINVIAYTRDLSGKVVAYVDGESRISKTSCNKLDPIYDIFDGGSFPGDSLDGELYEILVFDSDIGPERVAETSHYLKAEYSL